MNAQSHDGSVVLRTIPSVLALVTAKLLVERLDWEFIEANPLLAVVVAGAIFIVGLVLTARLHDDKEGGRLRTEIAAAIHAIRIEGAHVKGLHPGFDIDCLAARLGRITETLGADPPGRQEDIAAVEALTGSFLEMDRLGVSPDCIVWLKRQQALIVASLMRAAAIQRVAVLPLVYTLVETIVAGLIALLMFTRVATASTDLIVSGLTTLILLCLLRALRPAASSYGPTALRAGGTGGLRLQWWPRR